MILHFIVNACAILSLHYLSQPGYALNFLWRLFGPIPFLNKPLITCEVCMSSIWGTLYFALFYPIGTPLQWWPVHCLCVALCVLVLQIIVKCLKALQEYLEAKAANEQHLFNSKAGINA